VKTWSLLLGLLLTQVAVTGHFLFTPKWLNLPHEDLLYHFFALAVPTGWWFACVKDSHSRWMLGFCALLVAVLLEYSQKWSPYHVFDPIDALANITGAVVGAWLGAKSSTWR